MHPDEVMLMVGLSVPDGLTQSTSCLSYRKGAYNKIYFISNALGWTSSAVGGRSGRVGCVCCRVGASGGNPTDKTCLCLYFVPVCVHSSLICFEQFRLTVIWIHVKQHVEVCEWEMKLVWGWTLHASLLLCIFACVHTCIYVGAGSGAVGVHAKWFSTSWTGFMFYEYRQP